MTPRFSRFSPHLLPAAVLERRMVERAELADGLVSGFLGTLREGGARYVVLVGGRGAGKSHLHAVVTSRLRAAEPPIDDLLLLTLDEEEHVSGLLDLLARLLRRLPEEAGLPHPTEQVALLRGLDRGEAVERAERLIVARLAGRRLLICLENLDRLLAALSTEEQWRLRALLSGQGWSVFATAQSTGDDLHHRDRPFYRMWSEEPLPALSPEACRDMLYALALDRPDPGLAERLMSPLGLARVRAIHHLIGGSPRGMALVFPYLTRESLDELESAFFQLGDELTPYFQEQIRARAPGQQALLERLSESWGPLTVTELVHATFSTQGTVSGQLRYLKRDGLVYSHSVGRDSFYELADPLWRLARAMKRPDQAPRVFIRFLRFWHTRPELLLHLQTPGEGREDLWREALEWVGDDEVSGTAFFAESLTAMEGAPPEHRPMQADALYARAPCAKSAVLRVTTRVSQNNWSEVAATYSEIRDRFAVEDAVCGAVGLHIANSILDSDPIPAIWLFRIQTDWDRGLIAAGVMGVVNACIAVSTGSPSLQKSVLGALQDILPNIIRIFSSKGSLENTIPLLHSFLYGKNIWSPECIAGFPSNDRKYLEYMARGLKRSDLVAIVTPFLHADATPTLAPLFR